jgi:hypothetical integral membrane protein (TIGR02206 family)
MEPYFARFYFGTPFELFGTAHLSVLILVVVLNLLVIFRRRSFTTLARRILRYSLAALLLLCQFSYVVWLLWTGDGSIQNLLPLHLCSLFSLLSAIMLLMRSQAIYEYAYYIGSAGALYALITPDLGFYGFPHFLFIQSMTVHACLFTAQVTMTCLEGFRPGWQSVPRGFLVINLYMVVVAVINSLTGSNYLFLSHPPEGFTMLDWLGSKEWYYIGLEVALLATFLILYIPFFIGKISVRLASKNSLSKIE